MVCVKKRSWKKRKNRVANEENRQKGKDKAGAKRQGTGKQKEKKKRGTARAARGRPPLSPRKKTPLASE